ncbi:MAG: DNA recombination protein RmuC [Gammaproteobacteria bacterium]|nr:DNA recombination protein RmuC [Gammaproteobacteria bacterium]NNM13204.1 DNA recombination protein RmuC [Gammaproteobacteria bacterium]
MNQLTLNPELLIAVLSGALIGFLFGLLIRSLLAQRLINTEKEQRLIAETRLKHQEELDEERDSALELARERLENAFHELADQSLAKNNDQFLQLATQKLSNQQQQASSDLEKRQLSIKNLLEPISDALKKTETQIGSIEKTRHQSFGELKQELSQLRDTQSVLQSETRNLVNALRKPQVRGRWGEQTLKRVVEVAGMVHHCDFTEQVSSDMDSRLRPDMIVSLPDQRKIVVDAKTPLQAYLDALESSSNEDIETNMSRHVQHIKTHIKQLASKQYWDAMDNTPEFVVMFIPGEQFLSAALDKDPELFDQALQQNVILATPNSLIALLKTVAYGWRQVELANNAENIRKIAEDLYKRLSTFTNHIAKIGTNLQRSSKAYNDALGSLERSVLPGARKFKEMGISASQDLAKLESLEENVRIPKSLKNLDDE